MRSRFVWDDGAFFAKKRLLERYAWDGGDIKVLPGRADYSPDEERAADGKWTGGAGGGSSGAKATPEAWVAANPHANPHVFSTAQSYLQQTGRAPLKVLAQQTMLPDEGRSIAAGYDAAKDDPSNVETQAAYRAFNSELASQRAVAEKAGYKFEAWDKPGQPYATSKEMMQDVKDNKHLFYFKSTEGTTPNKMMSLQENDTFRAVHDLFGHAMAGNQFGPKGETNAFLDHVQMFSPEARKALATETVGQNAWFNFGKANEGKPIGERHFADQKAFLLDPKLYQPLIDRSMKQDAADEEETDFYHACPCHRRAEAKRADYSPDQPRDPDGKFGDGNGGQRIAGALSKISGRIATGDLSKSVTPEQHLGIAEGFLAKHQAGLEGAKSRLQDVVGKDLQVQGRVKELSSALEKIARKPHYGTVDQIQDATGLRIVTPDLGRQQQAIAAIKTHYSVITEDNYVEHPREGYRAYHIVVRDTDGLAKEIQLQTQNERRWQSWSHDIYKPQTDEQRQVVASNHQLIADYGEKVSNVLYQRDRGQHTDAPPCPQVLHQTFGCLD